MSQENLRIVCADDEPMARSTLRQLLDADADVTLVAEAANGDEAVALVRAHKPDLLLLDVQMPGKDGFAVLEELGEDEAPRVVFVTAYDRYALRAFDVHAIDYLLKPFDDERFAQALARAKEALAKDRSAGMGSNLADLLVARQAELDGDEVAHDEGGATLERLSIHREGQIELVDVAAIDWIESADQYVQIHAGGGAHLMRESMARLEKRLPERFLRVHRSAIVPLDRIRSLRSTGSGTAEVELVDGTRLPVSRARAASVRRRVDEFAGA